MGPTTGASWPAFKCLRTTARASSARSTSSVIRIGTRRKTRRISFIWTGPDRPTSRLKVVTPRQRVPDAVPSPGGLAMTPRYERALIVGAGEGLSASLARALHGAGLRIGLAARDTDKLKALADSLGAAAHPCDVARPEQVDALFAAMDAALGGPPDVVVYNPSARVRGPFMDLD